MMFVLDLGKTPQETERVILLSIIFLCVGILSADILTPLGFVIWILYLVPLLMSVWLTSRYAPFIVTWLITGAIFLGAVIPASARIDFSDLQNRAIFILGMAVAALLAWEIRINYRQLEEEIKERSTTQENLEELTRTLEMRVSDRTCELLQVNAALATVNQKLTLLSQVTRHDISNRIFALLVEIDHIKELAGDSPIRKHLEKLERTTLSIQDQIAFTKDYQEIGAQAPSWHLVSSVIESAAEQLDHKNVQITTDLEGVKIFADPMIGRVFYNLIDNALRHGEHVTRIAFTYHLSGESLVIVAEDNGAGILAKDKLHIFAKGFGKDSGLGLFLIREILSITGISIKETGEPGTGARFEITVRPEDYRILPRETNLSS